MAQTVSEVMTREPITFETQTTAADAARAMRDQDIGAVLVDGDGLGIVTDRDIVVRAIADGKDPQSCTLGDICTRNPQTLTPDQPIEEAIRIMRDSKVRRIPVVDGGQPVGIVAIGDLAVERDRESALADISAASSNN